MIKELKTFKYTCDKCDIEHLQSFANGEEYFWLPPGWLEVSWDRFYGSKKEFRHFCENCKEDIQIECDIEHYRLSFREMSD